MVINKEKQKAGIVQDEEVFYTNHIMYCQNPTNLKHLNSSLSH